MISKEDLDLLLAENKNLTKALYDCVKAMEYWASDEDGVHCKAYDAYRRAQRLSASYHCARTGVQNCHWCSEIRCCDNMDKNKTSEEIEEIVSEAIANAKEV